VGHNLLPNCPITSRKDVLAAEDIWEPNIGSLRGKTISTMGEHVQSVQQGIPQDLMVRYRHVTLFDDIMFVNQIPFFVMISCKIATLLQALQKLKAIYSTRRFNTHLHGSRGWGIKIHARRPLWHWLGPECSLQ
jgi:hypothetical protein